jgi:glycosyltransferase involved in cell wall biosynthesis
MRITIAAGPFFPLPPGPAGAVERVWLGLAEEFARRGHSVTILERGTVGEPADARVNGVRRVRGPALVRTRRFAVNLAKDLAYSVWARTRLPEADVLVTNTFWLPALLAARRARVGRVAVHVQRMPKGQLGLYARAARFQAVSRAIADGIAHERPAYARRTRVFPNPIDTTVFAPPAGGRPGPAREVLFAGRIHPEKGLDLLVAAFARVAPRYPGLRLRLLGPWRVEEGGAGAEFVARLRGAAAGAPVDVSDPVYDRTAFAAALRTADVFCYPSLAELGEASPVAPVEAMATGLAPVVSALPQFRDTIVADQTGLVFDHRAADPVAALAAALDRLLSDDRLRAAIGAAASRRAAEFSYRRVADLYLADFNEMIAG